jgi:Sec-independent protein secretion pathway component TatC
MGAGIGITVAIVLSNYEELIFALTPSVATVIIYTGVFEAIITKIEITILMAMCLSVPHIAHSL